MASVEIHRSTDIYPPTGWHLSFQLVTFDYGEGQTPEHGYRFIWKRPGGALQAARGQARIPDDSVIRRLRAKAMVDGWLLDTEEEVEAYIAGLKGTAWTPPINLGEGQLEVCKAAFIAGARRRIKPGDSEMPAA